MGNSSNEDRDVELAYKVDRGFRGGKAGAGIGLVVGTFGYLLLSNWLPDVLFAPIVIGSTAIFAIVFGLFFPLELDYRELDDGPGVITPEERVKRLHSDKTDRK